MIVMDHGYHGHTTGAMDISPYKFNHPKGAGAAPLAGLMQERDRMAGRKVGVILCGGNIDTDWFRQVLAGETPVPA